MGRTPTGSIDQLRDGRWRLRATVAGVRTTLATYTTRTDAEAARPHVLAELERRSASTARESLTIATWGERWLDAREVSRTIRDVASDRGRLRLHIAEDPIGRVSLRRVTRGDVLEWLARLRAHTSDRTGRPLAGQSLRNVVAVLRGLLASAVDHGHLKANPAAGLRVATVARAAEPWTWLTPAELERLVAALPSPERHLVAFAAGSGLRAGELVALQLADVHADAIVVRYGAPGRPTKTRRIRRVPLLPLARAALVAWRAETAGRPNPLGLAFPGSHGAHRSRAHVIRWAVWRAALAAADLGRPVRWHDLRHTCASSLASGAWGRAWSLEEIREVLGHTTITITQRYAHLAASAVQRAADETRGIGRELAPAPSTRREALPPNPPESFKSRFRELNSRPTVYETVAVARDLAPLPRTGPVGGRCLAILEAAARGADVGAALAELRAELVEDMGRTLQRLSGPHALVEVARLAGVDDERAVGSRAN